MPPPPPPAPASASASASAPAPASASVPRDSSHLSNNAGIVQTFATFLTVAIHTILYERALYPLDSFIQARKYNFPVRQSRHPAVCEWINNAVSNISTLLYKSAVSRVGLVIHNEEGEVMERFMFDLDRFPIVEPKDNYTEFETREEANQALRGKIPIVDIEEQLRGTLRLLSHGCGNLSPLPQGCTFTLAVELRDKVDPPIGNPQPWIPAEPSLQTGEKGDSQTIGSDLGGVKSHPVRLVEAGEFILETWIEEGRAKYHDDKD